MKRLPNPPEVCHWLICGLAALLISFRPAGATAASAGQMISAFRATCELGFGDLARLKTAAAATHFAVEPITDRLPKSLVASRDGLWLVYRGASAEKDVPVPQCFIEMHDDSPGEYEKTVGLVRQAFGLGEGSHRTHPGTQSTRWPWQTEGTGGLQLILTSEILAGEPRLRLGIQNKWRGRNNDL